MSYFTGNLTPEEDEIREEMRKQNAKWGEQNHPDGTGPDVVWAFTGPASFVAESAKKTCDHLAEEGHVTWRDILTEEIAEAYTETDPNRLDEELRQAEAVIRQWRLAIRRRPTKSVLTNAEWKAEGVRRFGKDVYEWKFRCPSCGKVSSPRDLDTAGGNGFWAPQECIGRVHLGLGGLPDVKQHCNFHASNEPRLPGVIDVETSKGVPLPTLPFADPDPTPVTPA